MRQDDAFRAALLLAYLHGETKSAAALGDFLEEQGEPRIKPYGDRFSRFQVVLGVLPARLAHELACDFAEQALPAFEAERPDRPEPRLAVEAKRLWLAREIDDDELVVRRKAAFRLADTVRSASVLAQDLVRSRRPVATPFHLLARGEAMLGERVCQSAGHAASFAVHTTALYAARFAVYAAYGPRVHDQQEAQIDLLESALAAHAYVSAL
ncbi:MAG TPA: hypothetical protein VGN57_01800 [Pirellulaceae bacterium]|jgi:hypothetical protein|nr:hypothetical protein [Pirellulaceae bacterium]